VKEAFFGLCVVILVVYGVPLLFLAWAFAVDLVVRGWRKLWGK